MNFDKIEKLIQKANQDYNLLIIPDKNKVWDRLSQQLEIIENEIPRHQSLYKWDYKKFLFNLSISIFFEFLIVAWIVF